MVEEYIFSDHQGFAIDSRYYIEIVNSKVNVIIKSLSGSIRPSTGTRYNDEYSTGVERLLSILAMNRIRIDDLLIDSRETRRRNLSEEERRIGLRFPTEVWNHDIVELRKEICLIQSRTARRPEARSDTTGNATKQIRFVLDYTSTDIVSVIQLFSGYGQISEHEEIDNWDGFQIPRGLRPRDEVDYDTGIPIYRDGWIYVITNPAWPEWVKIGYSGNLKNRLRSFNTGVPNRSCRYRIRKVFPADSSPFQDAYGIEQRIHRLLEIQRGPGDSKEWYKMRVSEATTFIEDSLREYHES